MPDSLEFAEKIKEFYHNHNQNAINDRQRYHLNPGILRVIDDTYG